MFGGVGGIYFSFNGEVFWGGVVYGYYDFIFFCVWDVVFFFVYCLNLGVFYFVLF